LGAIARGARLASSRYLPGILFKSRINVELKRSIVFNLPDAHSAILYVLDGELLVRAGDREEEAPGEHAIALRGRGSVTLEAKRPAHFVLLAGAQIREPAVAHGPFLMNEMSEIEAAVARYHAGEMGRLERAKIEAAAVRFRGG
jgi:redox-sensitive bicupin YhaK (pirin superfamily)